MRKENFKSHSTLLRGTLVKRTVGIKNEKLSWLKIVWLRYDEYFGVIKFEYSLEEKEPIKIFGFKERSCKK